MANPTVLFPGTAVGPASDSDQEPAGVPLSEVAAVATGNSTSCRAWREQAIGWRKLYARQQVVINGTAGAWAALAQVQASARE